ncbi:MAG: GAF domain-containing protein [Hyphomicrobiaceae bacterium]
MANPIGSTANEYDLRIAALEAELIETRRQQATTEAELAQSVEYQTAIAEVLAVIARAPADLQPVLYTINAIAERLCGAERAQIFIARDGKFHLAAHHNTSQDFLDYVAEHPFDPGMSNTTGRAVLQARTIHAPDVLADPTYDLTRPMGSPGGARLSVPLLRDGRAIGVITVGRAEPRAFSDRQIGLVTTFADQAVIAIENARLFEAEQTRTKELTESLEYQTATSEVLGVISRSPSDLQPVLDAIVETAARVCGVEQAQLLRPVGDKLSPAAQFGGFVFAGRDGIHATKGTVSGRAYLEARTIHVHDLAAEIETEYPEARVFQKEHGGRTILATPLLRNGVPLGIILLRRQVVQPFTDQQIALLETFADQAVIAINNVGLFEQVQARTKEVTEALEYQTATSEVLSVISRSPDNLQPVLDSIVETAQQLCRADRSYFYLLRGGHYRPVASRGAPPEVIADLESKPVAIGDRGSTVGRVSVDKTILHVPDLAEDPEFRQFNPMASGRGRTSLAVPLLRSGIVIGVIILARVQVEPFTQRQIDLVTTFADQAVIAINNVGLFEEVQARTKELTESLEYQTATSEVLNIISRSKFELQPVFDAIVESGLKLFPGAAVVITRPDDGKVNAAAVAESDPERVAAIRRRFPVPLTRDYMHAIAILDHRVVDIPDASNVPPDLAIGAAAFLASGNRAITIMPMMRGDQAIGGLSVMRQTPGALSAKQVELLRTFADQAVIAINNVGLFEEVQARTREVEARSAELAQSLDYQTAISTVLSVISRSPGVVQPVLDTIVETSARLARADFNVIFMPKDDGLYHLISAKGTNTEWLDHARKNPLPKGRGSLIRRTALEARTVHIHDCLTDPEFSALAYQKVAGFRTMLGIPLLRQGIPIGVIGLSRAEVSPFSDAEIELVETFADQAVIAIENARLFEAEQTRTKELSEALNQQTATADVLKAISRSAFDLQPVLDTLVRSAAKLCSADYALIRQRTGESYYVTATAGFSPEQVAHYESYSPRPVQGSIFGRAVLNKRTEHVPDILADPRFERSASRLIGLRAVAVVPMLRDGDVIGVFSLMRAEPRPFTATEIALVESFADQAVIAIENARLLDELQTRQRELTEALEYQTATSEVLGVISRSTNELQPVLQAITETASQLCDSEFAALFNVVGDECVIAAGNNARTEFIQYLRDNPVPIEPGSAVGRAAYERKTFHVEDVLTLPGYTRSASQKVGGHRTVLTVPLFRDGDAIGVIALMRSRVKAFTEKQIKLVETFADQAVIAMNNARLFNEVQERTKELTESLEYQTATAEVLAVISASPSELQPVLDAIVETAGRLCEADYAHCRLEKDGRYHVMARHSPRPEVIERMAGIPITADRTSVTGRAVLERRTIHLPDISLDPEETYTERVGSPSRTSLGVPLLRGGEVIGVIGLFRLQVRPFTERQIELVTTFADQAVIAINNVGLFEEVQARSKELARSVEELQALGEVGQVVSSSLDKEKVLQTVIENACKMAYADGGTIYGYDTAADAFRLEAGYNMSEEHIARVRAQPIRMGDPVVGECAERRETIVVEDLEQSDQVRSGLIDILRRAGVRAVLSMPLIHQDKVIGALVVRRSHHGPFTPETQKLLEAFATQSAIAINNARLFKEVEEKGEQLRLASQHKSQFLANMSHELRTPLNAILGYTELMQDGIYGSLPEKASGVIDRVQSNGKHLLGLINSVLDLSKIEAGQLKLALVEYGIGSLIETVVAATESLATAKNLTLVLDVAKNLPRGVGDEQRIVQVLLNLVGNAIKFTEKGEIRIHAGVFAGRFQIAVADTGAGIPEPEQARIFEEFHQVDSSNTKAKGGTGLGLAIAKRIVELHGGRIWVESIVGKGSTFKVELPQRAAQVQAPGEEATRAVP